MTAQRRIQVDLLQLTHLHADLSYGPGGVVADRDELRVQICPEDWHEFSCRTHTHTHARKKNVSIPLDTLKIEDDGTIMYVLYECVCEIDSEIITNTRFDMREAGLGQVPQ